MGFIRWVLINKMINVQPANFELPQGWIIMCVHKWLQDC